MTEQDPDSARAAAGEAEGWAGIVADLVSTQIALRYAWVAALVPTGARVLDVGCGLGAGAQTLVGAGGIVCGVDRPAIVGAAPERVRNLVELVPGSLDRLPIADRSFDVVVCVTGLDSGRDPKASIEELVRVLTPGGLLVVAASAVRDSGAGEIDGTGDRLSEMLTERGFSVAAFSESAWLATTIAVEVAPVTVDPGPSAPAALVMPALVIASTSPLLLPAPAARIVTEIGVARLQTLERAVARELSDARAEVFDAERQRDEVAAVEARLATAERELAALVELEVAIGAALEERDEARAEATAARTEANALRDSTTWRATAPLRWLSARARGKPYA